MTLNLTELRDEPLGTPTVRDGGRRPFASWWQHPPSGSRPGSDTEMALGDAADGEGVFKIDVDALSDEVLDPGYTAAPSRTGHFLPATYQGGCQSPDTVGGYGA